MPQATLQDTVAHGNAPAQQYTPIGNEHRVQVTLAGQEYRPINGDI
jgi:hypothetical protein